MWKKAKRFLAVLLALTLMLSVVDSEELFVSASATNVQEDTGAGGETEPAAGEETKSTDVSVEEDTAVTSVGDEGSGEDTATVPGDGTGTGTETGGAADETGTDGTETAGTGTETSGSGTEGAEGTTVPGSETPANGTEGTEGAAGTGDTTAGESGETEGDVTDGTTEAADDGTDGTTTVPGTVTDGSGSEGTGTETETGENGTVGTEDGNVTTDGAEGTGSNEIKEETGIEDSTVEVEEENPQAAVEAAAMPEGAQVPEGYTVQRTVRDEENGFAVTVYAPEGVIPEDAVLSAVLLSEDDDAYLAAEEALAAEIESEAEAQSEDGEAEEPSYGFAALDIHFEDADGVEIEPDGDVYVVIDATELLPEDADPETVTVQHHAEQENGDVTVETVADTSDATDGVVAVEDSEAQAADVQAAFEVSGFSTFTVYWSYSSSPLKIHLIDTEGQPIGGEAEIGHTWIGHATTIEEIVNQIGQSDNEDLLENYTFIRAEKANSANNAANDDNDDNNVRRIRRNDKWWQYSTQSSGNSWYSITYGNAIYLIYEDNSTPGGDIPSGGGTVTEVGVTAGKTAIQNDDGTYDLTLSVSGSRGSVEDPAEVDILLVVDKSGSMAYDLDQEKGSSRERMDAVVTAVQSLTSALEGNNAVSVQYNLITFSSLGFTDSDRDTGWTTNATTINNAVSYFTETGRYGNFSHNLEGGTNYQYAISKAKNALNSDSVRLNAQQIVIFLTDGIPTHKGLKKESQDNHNGADYWEQDWPYGGHWETNANPDFHNTDAAINELNGLNADAFYCIGIGEVFDEAAVENDPENGRANLERIVNAAKTAVSSNSTLYTTSSSSALEEFFRQIAGSVSFFAAENVIMTDPLSEYAEIVATDGTVMFEVTLEKQNDATGEYEIFETENVSSGSSARFTTTAIDEDGNEVETEFIITPSYDSTERIISASLKDVNGGAYALAPGYRYSITTVITPSQTAINVGMDSEEAKNNPDAGTGTHAERNEMGFWSNNNDDAKVTYTANSQDGFTPFPRPVIQIQKPTSAKLTLTKTFVGLSDAEVTYLIFRNNGFGFDVNYCVDKAYNSGTTGLTYMAPTDDLDGFTMPGSDNAMNNGGDFGFLAKDYLGELDTVPEDGEYVNVDTGASLRKNDDGDWVFSITLTVPVCDDDHFFTVYEQHAEVPGYAKLNDSSATYTINGTEYTGKFVDYDCDDGIYEDMTVEVEVNSKFTGKNAREETAIETNRFTRLVIKEDTTIAFTNNYSGKLDVTKAVGSGNELADADETKTYNLTIEPAHEDKLELSTSGNEHGLAGKEVQYQIKKTDGSSGDVETGRLGNDGSLTVSIHAGETIHFLSLPAIQWKVTENGESAAEAGYTLNVSYIDANNGVVNTGSHWNNYADGETIGATSTTDGIASVNSAVRNNEDPDVDASAVALVTVTNTYTRNDQELTVSKYVTGEEADLSATFTFVLRITDNGTVYQGPITMNEEELTYTADDVDGYQFTLKNNESATFEIPYGMTATIRETVPNGYQVFTRTDYTGSVTPDGNDDNGNQETEGYWSNTDATVSNITMTQDHTVDFKNYRPIVAPTGMETNHTAPFAIMVTISAFAGLALIGSLFAYRNRRRHRM